MDKITTELIRNEINGITSPTADSVFEILRAIATLDRLTERSLLLNDLAKKTKIAKRDLRAELDTFLPKDPATDMLITENIVIAHPAYDVNDLFMSLGFKEPVIEGKKVMDRNFYLVAHGDGFHRVEENTVQIGGFNVVFDVRNRILPTIGERWDKKGLGAFIKNPVEPNGVYGEVKQTIQAFVEFQKDAHYGLLAAWVIATYFARCFHAVPFLSILGKKQSGKSRLLELLNHLCFNAIKTKGVSLASLADSVDGVRGVFLQDQAESLSMEKYRELLGILTDSYTIGGGKRRVVDFQNRERRIAEFETYGFKAFASTKDVDTDLKDRCITIAMVRAAKEYPYPEAHLPLWGNVRDKLYRLALLRWKDVKAIYQNTGKNAKQRVRELWRPLETVLTLEGVDPAEITAIYEVFLEAMEEAQVGLSPMENALFEALFRLLTDESTRLLSAEDIRQELHGVETGESRPFTSERSLQTWIGHRITRLYVYSEKLPPDGKRQKYRFDKDHVVDIFNRYQIGSEGSKVQESNNDSDIQTETFLHTEPQGSEVQPQDETLQPPLNLIEPIKTEVQHKNHNSNNGSEPLQPFEPLCMQTEKLNADGFLIEEESIPDVEGERWSF
jgi:hypothetical protein